MNIREKEGVSYNNYSFYNAFIDSGFYGIYAATDPILVHKLLKLIDKEIIFLSKVEFNDKQTEKIKKQYIGSMVMSWESLHNQMTGQAKDLLDFGEVTTLTKAIEMVSAVSTFDLNEAAHQAFQPEKTCKMIFLPKDSDFDW
jgi:predicted Zn-dependent peptidase